MTEPDTYSFERYLEAKRTVDERALDRRVEARLVDELTDTSAPLRVLEVGAGIGTAIERVIGWESLPAEVRYTAVDADPDLIERARSRLLTVDDRQPVTVHEGAEEVIVEREGGRVVVDLVAKDAFEFVAGTAREFDLLIAQAFLDLTAVRPALAAFSEAMAPAGLAYFPITFDGATILEPPLDPDLDDRIERRFHDHMDDTAGRGPQGGDPRAGRHLLEALPSLGGAVLAVGSSDWVVVPDGDGYPHDESYFLHHIIELIRGALADDPSLDSARFRDWVEQRHRQIDHGQLVYIAHQLDVLSRYP